MPLGLRYEQYNPVTTTPIMSLPKPSSNLPPPGFLPGFGPDHRATGLLEQAQAAMNPHRIGMALGQKMAAFNTIARQAGASSVLDAFMTGEGSTVSKVEDNQSRDLPSNPVDPKTPPPRGAKGTALRKLAEMSPEPGTGTPTSEYVP